MLRQLGIVVLAAAFYVAASAPPATAREGTMTPAVSAADVSVSAQKVKRARKPAARRIATVRGTAPYYQQCFLFICNNGRPFHWLVLGVAY